MDKSYVEEIPKYIKQKESDISKSNRKSKHKHKYEECLIRYELDSKHNISKNKEQLHMLLSSYCVICGKIGKRFDSDKTIVKDFIIVNDSLFMNYKNTSIISIEKLYEEYHDKMPVFFVKNIFKDKYVDLEQKL